MSVSDNKKKKTEPAEKLLTLRPTVRYTPEKGGFTGWLYRANPNMNPGSVMIILGGSDGSFALTKLVAEQFVKNGINALALACWNQEGLPAELKEVPLDYLERAAERMQRLGLNRIILWGFGIGAVAVLNVAACRPELFAGIISVSGVDFTPQSLMLEEGKIIGTNAASTFTWHGEPLPYEPVKYDPKQIRKDSFRNLEMVYTSCFKGKETALENPGSRIPVEKITCPVIAFSAEQDTLWPSALSSARMMKQMDQAGTAGPHRLLTYPKASHNLLPVKPNTAFLFKTERKYPEECTQSRQDAYQQAMIFIKQLPQ